MRAPFLAALALAFATAPVHAQSTPDPDYLERLSYGELAAHFIAPLYHELIVDLSAIGPDTLPHETKQIRKNIGALREYIDVFVFAYPDARGRDPWEDVREELDEGYETIGAFKDLFDSTGIPIEEIQSSTTDPTGPRRGSPRPRPVRPARPGGSA